MLCLVLFSFNRKHLPVSNVLQALWIFSKCSDFFFYDFLKTVPCPILLIHKKLSHKTHKFQQCGPATSSFTASCHHAKYSAVPTEEGNRHAHNCTPCAKCIIS